MVTFSVVRVVPSRFAYYPIYCFCLVGGKVFFGFGLIDGPTTRFVVVTIIYAVIGSFMGDSYGSCGCIVVFFDVFQRYGPAYGECDLVGGYFIVYRLCAVVSGFLGGFREIQCPYYAHVGATEGRYYCGIYYVRVRYYSVVRHRASFYGNFVRSVFAKYS